MPLITLDTLDLLIERLASLTRELGEVADELRQDVDTPPTPDPPSPPTPDPPPPVPEPVGAYYAEGYPAFSGGVDRGRTVISTTKPWRNVRTQSELDAAINDAATGIVDVIAICTDGLTIGVNRLGGIQRSYTDCVFITSADGIHTLKIELQDDRASFSGVAFTCLDVGQVLIRGGADILFEDCKGTFDVQGVRTPNHDGTPIRRVYFRHCTMRDAWTPGSRPDAHGVFAYNFDGLLLQNCWLHHNGWKPGATRSLPASEGGPTIRNHNAYFAAPYTGLLMEGCLSSEPSSHGVTAKAGDTIRNNLFVNCPIGAQAAFGGDGNYTRWGNWSAEITGNLFVGSEDINTSDGNVRGIGLWLASLADSEIFDNVFVYNQTSPTSDSVMMIERKFPFGYDVQIGNNTAYSWAGSIRLGAGSSSIAGLMYSSNDFDRMCSPTQLAAAKQLMLDVNDPNFGARITGARWNYGLEPSTLAAEWNAIEGP